MISLSTRRCCFLCSVNRMTTKQQQARRRRRTRSRSRRRRRRQSGGSIRLPSSPNPSFQVSWPSTVKATAAPGPEVAQEAARAQPAASWASAPTSTPLTLIAYDPDAPGSSSATPYLHWLVVNTRAGTPSSGSTITPWAPPTPPKGSGTHRYVFQLYKQAASIPITPSPAPKRPAFPLEGFIQEHSLTPYTPPLEIRVAAPPS